MLSQLNLLTNYKLPHESFIGKLSNFALKPLIIGAGREVQVNFLSNDRLQFVELKIEHIAIRVFAILAALVLLPLTASGALLKLANLSHTPYAQRETQFLLAVENASRDVKAQLLASQSSPQAPTEENLVTRLNFLEKLNSYLKTNHLLHFRTDQFDYPGV